MSFKSLEFKQTPADELAARSLKCREQLSTRRSVRHFSKRSVPLQVIEDVIITAASAPSGANQPPWTSVVVKDQNLKHQIRVAAEKEERSFYQQLAPNEWLEMLKPEDG